MGLHDSFKMKMKLRFQFYVLEVKDDNSIFSLFGLIEVCDGNV